MKHTPSDAPFPKAHSTPGTFERSLDALRRRALAMSITGAMLGFACQGCTLRVFNKTSSPATSPLAAPDGGRFRACVALQGNGVKFPSHVGAFVALLEQDVVPEVVIGGSSGSIVGSILRGLLGNPSLKLTTVTRAKAALSEAQKAALVLAASPDVIDSFLFLPALNRGGALSRSILHLVYALGFGNSLGVGPESVVMSLEAVVGQAVLIVDFFSQQDFRSVVTLPTYEQRAREMRRLWYAFSGVTITDGKELVASLFTPADSPSATPRRIAIARRWFEMFREDPSYTQQQDSVEAWEEFNERLKAFLGLADKDPLGFGRRFWDSVSEGDVPFIGKADFFNAWFPLVDPKLAQNAWLGYRREAAMREGPARPGEDTLFLPEGMVIHSTFRSADRVAGSARWKERSGLENLFQAYIIPKSLQPAFVERLRASEDDPSKAFMPYRKGDTFGSFLPSTNILVLAPRSASIPYPTTGQVPRGLAFAIKASAGEPGPFRRDALDVSLMDVSDALVRASFRGANEGTEFPWNVVSFGGWAESNAMTAISHLPECEMADLLVTSGKPGEGNAFQRAALRAAMYPIDYARALRLEKSRQQDASTLAEHARLDAALAYARTLRGRLDSGIVRNDINFDAPNAHPNARRRKDVNSAIGKNRMALMLAGYQRTMASLRVDAPSVPRAEFSVWDQDLADESDSLLTTGDARLPGILQNRLYPNKETRPRDEEDGAAKAD